MVLMDTGPLVAFFVRSETHHGWAVEQFSALTAPVFLCEAVLAEACFLLSRGGVSPERLLQKVREEIFQVRFSLQAELGPVIRLLHRYRNLPMSLADACLVRMAELYEGAAVLTLDGHFRIYRKNGRQTLPVILPGR